MHTFLTIFLLLSGLSSAWGSQSTKRSELIALNTANLERIWQLNETFPPDIYLSSLGSLLLSSNSNDPVLNAKITMASASILYTASKTSLLMSAEAFKSQARCNEVFSQYKKVNTPDPDELCTANDIEMGVCLGLNIRCQKAICRFAFHCLFS